MRKTLLLADDSVTIQKVVGITFANEDVELVTVDNGDEALSRAREIHPDLVLADVAMPGLSGYELCRSMRQDPELAGIPVLLLTGTFETFDDRRAAEVGASGHIAKPFEAQALIDQVQALLAEVASAPPMPPTPEVPREAAAPDAQPSEPLADFSGAEAAFAADDAPAPRPLGSHLEASPPPPLAPPWSEASEISVEDLRDAPPSERFLGATLSQGSQPPAPGLVPPEPSRAEAVLGETTFPPATGTPPAPEPDPALEDSSSSHSEEELQFAEPEAAELGETQEPTRVHPEPPVEADSIDEPDSDSGLEPALVEPRPWPPMAEQAAPAAEEAPEEELDEEDPDLPWAEALEEEPLGSPPGEDRDLPGADALFEDSLRFADELDGSAPTLDPELSITHAADDPPLPSDSSEQGSFSDELPEVSEVPEVPETPEVPEIPEEPEPSVPPSPKQGEEPTWYASAEPLDPEVVRQALEKVAWEAFGSLSQDVVREIVRKVEEIAWEVIPELAERLILEEIARLKADSPAE